MTHPNGRIALTIRQANLDVVFNQACRKSLRRRNKGMISSIPKSYATGRIPGSKAATRGRYGQGPGGPNRSAGGPIWGAAADRKSRDSSEGNLALIRTFPPPNARLADLGQRRNRAQGVAIWPGGDLGTPPAGGHISTLMYPLAY